MFPEANGAAPVATFCRVHLGAIELCDAPGAPEPMVAPGWRPFALDAAVDDVAIWVQLGYPVDCTLVVGRLELDVLSLHPFPGVEWWRQWCCL